MKKKLNEELSSVEKKLKAVRDDIKEPFDAVSMVKTILDQCEPGTKFIMQNKKMFYRFVKSADGKWDVTLGRSKSELDTNKASHDSVNMTAGEVVNCLYGLE